MWLLVVTGCASPGKLFRSQSVRRFILAIDAISPGDLLVATGTGLQRLRVVL
jgi:hypothetical protein